MLKSSYAKPHGVPRPSRALCAGCSAHGASSNWPPRAFGLLLSYWFDVAAPGHHGPMSDLGHDSMTGRTCLLLCALLHALASISSPSVVQDLVVAYIMTQHIPHRELRRVKKKKGEPAATWELSGSPKPQILASKPMSGLVHRYIAASPEPMRTKTASAR